MTWYNTYENKFNFIRWAKAPDETTLTSLQDPSKYDLGNKADITVEEKNKVIYSNKNNFLRWWDSDNMPLTINLSEFTSQSIVSNTYTSVIFGDGLFVAVGQGGGGAIFTSPDGITWTNRIITGNYSFTDITYGGGLFVAVSDNNDKIITSPDGIIWTGRTTPLNIAFKGVTYGNGLYVAVGSAGAQRIITSPDGITWTARNQSNNSSWQSVRYLNDKFISVGFESSGSTSVMYSTNGIDWNDANGVPIGYDSWNVTYGNGLYVSLAAFSPSSLISTDGINWSVNSIPNISNTFYTNIIFAESLFIGVAQGGDKRIVQSRDGINWIAIQDPENNTWFGLGYGDNIVVSCSTNGTNQIMRSTIEEVKLLTKDSVKNFFENT